MKSTRYFAITKIKLLQVKHLDKCKKCGHFVGKNNGAIIKFSYKVNDGKDKYEPFVYCDKCIINELKYCIEWLED